MPFISNKSTFTPSGTVFSKFIALELLSETLSLRLWRSYDVTSRYYGDEMSLLVSVGATIDLWKYFQYFSHLFMTYVLLVVSVGYFNTHYVIITS